MTMAVTETAAGAVKPAESCADLFLTLGAEDERVVVLAGDLARYCDVLPFAERFPERYFNLGMAEANIIGIASGLAKSGLRPIVATYGVFITRRAYDQVAMALTTGPTPVVLAGFLPGITCRFAASHQAVDDMALMGSLPGMRIVDPGDLQETDAALRGGLAADHPTYIRALGGYPRQLLPAGSKAGAPVLLGDKDGEFGMISTGLGTHWALDAVEVLRAQGRRVSLLHMPEIKPFDRETAVSFCRRFSHVVTVENHIAHGGLHGAVAMALAERGGGVRLTPAAIPDAWGPSGTADHIRQEIGLGAEAIARRVLERGE